MGTRTQILILLVVLLAANAYGTLRWQLRPRLLHRSTEPPWLFPGLTLFILLAASTISAYAQVNSAFALGWKNDRLILLAKAACSLSAVPALWAGMRTQLQTRAGSADFVGALLWIAPVVACVFVAIGIGNIVSGKVTPPLASLTFPRQLFHVFAEIGVYALYAGCAAAVGRWHLRVREAALDTILVVYVVYIVGMIGFRLYFPDFYQGKGAAFLDSVRAHTFALLVFALAISFGAASKGLPASASSWLPNAYIANALLALLMPVLATTLDRFYGFLQSNTFLVISTSVQAVLNVVVGLISRSLIHRLRHASADTT